LEIASDLAAIDRLRKGFEARQRPFPRTIDFLPRRLALLGRQKTFFVLQNEPGSARDPFPLAESLFRDQMTSDSVAEVFATA